MIHSNHIEVHPLAIIGLMICALAKIDPTGLAELVGPLLTFAGGLFGMAGYWLTKRENSKQLERLYDFEHRRRKQLLVPPFLAADAVADSPSD